MRTLTNLQPRPDVKRVPYLHVWDPRLGEAEPGLGASVIHTAPRLSTAGPSCIHAAPRPRTVGTAEKPTSASASNALGASRGRNYRAVILALRATRSDGEQGLGILGGLGDCARARSPHSGPDVHCSHHSPRGSSTPSTSRPCNPVACQGYAVCIDHPQPHPRPGQPPVGRVLQEQHRSALPHRQRKQRQRRG